MMTAKRSLGARAKASAFRPVPCPIEKSQSPGNETHRRFAVQRWWQLRVRWAQTADARHEPGHRGMARTPAGRDETRVRAAVLKKSHPNASASWDVPPVEI